MPQATLYLNVVKDRLTGFLYRLIKQVFYRNIPLIILFENDVDLLFWNDFLWSNETEEFIAHNVWNDDEEDIVLKSPVLLIKYRDFGDWSKGGGDQRFKTLLNLTPYPIETNIFSRILEVYIAGEESIEVARKHYKFYKALHYQLDYFDMSTKK